MVAKNKKPLIILNIEKSVQTGIAENFLESNKEKWPKIIQIKGVHLTSPLKI